MDGYVVERVPHGLEVDGPVLMPRKSAVGGGEAGGLQDELC
ncbi:hypothetical protein THIX_20497 [Thiomonas sp. X19]|nr:hypothetical protein [Thiomonas sp. X19]SCC92447.1 hypothetical protein THIX_20497 [Thiomonas sp. X19]